MHNPSIQSAHTLGKKHEKRGRTAVEKGMCHVCVGVRRAYRTSWAEMGGACFADEKPDADGRSLGMRARRWVGSGLARVCNNYSIPRVEISHVIYIYI